MQKPKDEIFLEMPALLSAVKWGAVWNSTSADCCRRCCWCDTLEAAAEEGTRRGFASKYRSEWRLLLLLKCGCGC